MDFKKLMKGASSVAKSAAGYVANEVQKTAQKDAEDYEKYSQRYSRMSDDELRARYARKKWSGTGEIKAFKDELDYRGISL